MIGIFYDSISDLRFLSIVNCGYTRPLFSIYIISADKSSVASLIGLLQARGICTCRETENGCDPRRKEEEQRTNLNIIDCFKFV